MINVSLFLLHHPYLIVFAGMLFGGEGVFLPAIYLALLGKLNFFYLIPAAISASVVSDAAWYALGRFSSSHKFTHAIFEKRRGALENIASFFHNHGLHVLFYSKFVYGTRIIAQIMAGKYRIPFVAYFFVNLLAVTTLILVITGIGIVIETGHRQVGALTAVSRGVAFIIFVIFVSALHVGARRIINIRRKKESGVARSDVVQ